MRFIYAMEARANEEASDNLKQQTPKFGQFSNANGCHYRKFALINGNDSDRASWWAQNRPYRALGIVRDIEISTPQTNLAINAGKKSIRAR